MEKGNIILPSLKLNENFPVVSQKSLIMIFDVETSGLLPKPNKEELSREKIAETFFSNSLPTQENTTESLPHIIHLSYVIYDTLCQEVVKIYNQYIQLPTNFTLSEKITEITGITQDICDRRGIPISDALEEFAKDYLTCKTIVSHNFQFDSRMIKLELARHWSNGYIAKVFNKNYEEENSIDRYCTMMQGTRWYYLYQKENGYPNPKWKWPKLVQLYQAMFNKTPDHLHNSLIDTLVCLRCYLKMRHNLDVNEENFAKMLEDAYNS
jgi:DNA polymerase III epsilon subunit-like protein